MKHAILMAVSIVLTTNFGFAQAQTTQQKSQQLSPTEQHELKKLEDSIRKLNERCERLLQRYKKSYEKWEKSTGFAELFRRLQTSNRLKRYLRKSDQLHSKVVKRNEVLRKELAEIHKELNALKNALDAASKVTPDPSLTADEKAEIRNEIELVKQLVRETEQRAYNIYAVLYGVSLGR